MAFKAVNQVLEADNPFTVALTMALNSNPSNMVTKNALNVVAREWRSARVGVKKGIAGITKDAFTELKKKLASDWAIMGKVGVSDDHVMQWTQRRIESSFAFLKAGNLEWRKKSYK